MHGSDTTARAIAFSHPKCKMRPKRERPELARQIFASQPNRSTLGDDVQSVLRSREGWGSPQCMDRIPEQSHFHIQSTKCPKRERPKFARHIFASQPNRSTLGDDVQSVLRSREGWGSPQCMDRIPQPEQSHFLIQRTNCAQNASAPNSRGIYSLPNRIEAPWVMMFNQFYAAEKVGALHNAWIGYHSPSNRIFSFKVQNAPKTRAPRIGEAYIRFPTD